MVDTRWPSDFVTLPAGHEQRRAAPRWRYGGWPVAGGRSGAAGRPCRMGQAAERRATSAPPLAAP